MELTIVHLLYGLFTLLIIMTMVFRKGVVLPTLLGTFVIALVYKGSLVDGFISIFQANLVAAQELFSIFLIITFMLALLHSLRDLGADQRMIQPLQKLMVNGHISFFVLVAVTYVISLFFWPTPAVPLAGQGMALSSDYIVQVAPSLSAASAGIDVASVADQSLIMSLITGGIAILLAYLFNRKSIRAKNDPLNVVELETIQTSEGPTNKVRTAHLTMWSKFFAVSVPVSLLIVVIY